MKTSRGQIMPQMEWNLQCFGPFSRSADILAFCAHKVSFKSKRFNKGIVKQGKLKLANSHLVNAKVVAYI